MEEKKYSIGETAKMIGSTIKTVRYYDEIGLLKPTSYTEGGHRLYTVEDIWRLEMITNLRYLDFGIDEIGKIISEEISVDKALDWQIESMETQVNTLMDMISILRQAKEHDGDSLQYIHDLVSARTINAAQKKQFIDKKLKESQLLIGIPKEWRDSFFYYFDKYIINQVKGSAKQTAAWHELQELINDPQFIKDLKNTEFLYFNIVHQSKYNATTLVRKLENIQDRLNKALKQKLPANSPIVQTIIDDTARLYANSQQLDNKEDHFRYFAEYIQKTKTKRLERCETLCAILSPQYYQLSKANQLLFQGIEWRLEHMEES
ncbi:MULTISPECIES: MerR family transcriptional regulator [Lysinibacillus]|uniref:MerR family transcriptional regulator n=1 Tax=Lysinibacillus TaxID=400634 RepID=UPI000A4EE9B6|nr:MULTISPECIES: MerR family transcriptional regulator [Lysinibacillus]